MPYRVWLSHPADVHPHAALSSQAQDDDVHRPLEMPAASAALARAEHESDGRDRRMILHASDLVLDLLCVARPMAGRRTIAGTQYCAHDAAEIGRAHV